MQRTVLYPEHRALGARFTTFAGFEMPLRYPAGTLSEHRTVRRKAGLFDLSHMGEFRIWGPGAAPFLDWTTTTIPSQLAPGKVQYSLICNQAGGIIDDLTIYRLSADSFQLVVNAVNVQKDFEWLSSLKDQWSGPSVSLANISSQTALIALQGPASASIIRDAGAAGAAALGRFACGSMGLSRWEALISRTGYTGEDGFEIYVSADDAREVWHHLMTAGEPLGLLPVGLAARDTLRLEMGYVLYGADIDEDTTPLEAGLDWVVRWEKERFVGHQALRQRRQSGVSRRLVGLRACERSVPRPDCRVYAHPEPGMEVGGVTSGTLSPVLNTGIALAYVTSKEAAVGRLLYVQIRKHLLPYEVVKTPFVRPGSTLGSGGKLADKGDEKDE